MNPEDSGWRPAIRESWPFLLPWVGLLLARRPSRAKSGGLNTIRALFVHAIIWLFAILIILRLLNQSHHTLDHGFGWPLVVAGFGLIALTGIAWARSRPLITEDPRKLAGAYKGIFFISLGLADSAALFGFVAFFISSNIWVYVEGMALSLIGLWLIAPTRGAIARQQDKIQAQGSALSLLAAQLEPPMGGWRRRSK
jgi:hypothetical protein